MEPEAGSGSLWELGVVLFSLVSGLMLVIGVVELIEGHHHPISVWLLAGLLLTNCGTLVWAFRLRRGHAGGIGGDVQPPLPPLQTGQHETGVEETETGRRKWEREVKAVAEATEPSRDSPQETA